VDAALTALAAGAPLVLRYGQLKRSWWFNAAIVPGALVATTLATGPSPPSACASPAVR
jgi:hypothetical protein